MASCLPAHAPAFGWLAGLLSLAVLPPYSISNSLPCPSHPNRTGLVLFSSTPGIPSPGLCLQMPPWFASSSPGVFAKLWPQVLFLTYPSPHQALPFPLILLYFFTRSHTTIYMLWISILCLFIVCLPLAECKCYKVGFLKICF